MAQPAGRRSAGPKSALGLLLHPSRPRLELALRLALICTLTTFVTEHYGTPEPALTAYLVFFLNRSDRTTSLVLNVAFVALISIILAIVLRLAILVVDEPAWRVVTMTVASIAFLFLASASKLRPVGAILALIVVYALDVLGLVPTGEFATRGLLYTWLFVGIPAAISFATNLAFAPAPKRIAERALTTRLRAAAVVLREPDRAGAEAFAALRDEGSGEVLKLLHLAGVEGTLYREDAPRLQAAAVSTGAILFLVDALRRETDLPMGWRTNAANKLEEMAAAFEAGGYPVHIEPLDAPHEFASDRLGSALTRELNDVLRDFTEAGPGESEQAKQKAGFFSPDAFKNPEHVRYALKTTAAAMFCYFLYILLDWPGIHTCLITCYIVALSTTAETVEKLGLRILGCLAGAAAGTAAIVWILPTLDSLGALLVVVFAGAFCGAWVAAGSRRISYAGFQFAFAFFLCVIQGAGPAFDLTIARDRVIGILIGNVVTYLVFTHVWPVTIAHRIEQGFASLLAELVVILRLPLPARWSRAPAIQAQATAIRDDLDLLTYEPARVRPKPGWSAARLEALHAIVTFERPALADDHATFWVQCAERLEQLRQHLSGADGASSADPIEIAGGSLTACNRLQSVASQQLLKLVASFDVRP